MVPLDVADPTPRVARLRKLFRPRAFVDSAAKDGNRPKCQGTVDGNSRLTSLPKVRE